MTQAIQVSLDSQGRIVIPSLVRERLHLSQGMTLVVENGKQGEVRLRVQEELPVLVDKEGVLVVAGSPRIDLLQATQTERNRRVSELVQRVGL